MSIDQQIEELKEYATNEHLNIIEFFTEAKTAKKPGRAVFNNLLKLVEKGYANGIVAWNPDRLARNSVDGGHIIYLLDTGKLQSLKFPTFWFENTPQGRFMLNIAFGQAKYYVDTLSENVARGLYFKVRHGGWPGYAPLGYKNDKNTLTVVPDEVKAPIVAKAFELFASHELETLRDVREYFYKHGITRRNGKPSHLTQIHEMLSRPFYYGLMVYSGETYEGNHIPLISKELFNRVQERLFVDYSTPHPQKHDFAFTGFIKCAECGGFITAEKHTKHYPRTARTVDYVYYRCSKKHGYCAQPYVTEQKVETELRELVEKVSLNTIWEQYFSKRLTEDEKLSRENMNMELVKLTSTLEAVEKKLDKLLESFLEEVIDQETYQSKKNQLLQDKVLLTSKIKEVKAKGSSWVEPFREWIEESADADKVTRAKKNCNQLSLVAKKVGSNYLLDAGRVLFSPRKPATLLAARATAAAKNPDSLLLSWSPYFART